MLNDWLPVLQVRPSTAESYRRNLSLHVLPRIGSLRLQDLHAGHLNRVYAELLADGRLDSKMGGLSARTVRYIHTILRRSLQDAVRWGRILRNPAVAADPPRSRDAAEAAPEMRT